MHVVTSKRRHKGREYETTLVRSYEFLRHLETVLRRWRNTSASSLPADPIEQRKLAIRMGFKGWGDWQQAYESARADIHAICGKHFVG